MKGIADFTRGPVTKQLICFALPLFNQACYIFGYGQAAFLYFFIKHFLCMSCTPSIYLDGFLFFLFPVIIFLSVV